MNLARWAREPFSTLGSRQWPAILHIDVRFRKRPLQKHIHGFAAHTTSELVTYLVKTGFRRYSCLFCACITTLHYRNLMHRCPGCGFPHMQQNEQDSPRILAFEPQSDRLCSNIYNDATSGCGTAVAWTPIESISPCTRHRKMTS